MAALGLDAKRAKSGSLTMSVAKFEIADMMPVMIPHASSDPCASLGWRMIGPAPPRIGVSNTVQGVSLFDN